MNRKH